jgi:hypothetical protein
MVDLFHTCDVARNQAVGTNGRKAYSPIAARVACLFLPMSTQAAIQNQFSIGYAWDIYFSDGTDVQVGDKLTYSGQTYIVRGRQPYAGIPLVSHLHITAETEHANGQ